MITKRYNNVYDWRKIYMDWDNFINDFLWD